MIFLDLGRQPLANGFLTKDQFDKEIFYNLQVDFDEQSKLVSLVEQPAKETLFNENYPYYSSCSATMRVHFKEMADKIKKFNPNKVLEIGSNDGVFIKNFEPKQILSIEPCSNFANITREMGYETLNEFWTGDTAQRIVKDYGAFDVIYAANCMCHIKDIQEAFCAVEKVLSRNGKFIFEDPSLQEVLQHITYDQFYDEHAHVFSVIALKELLGKAGLVIFKVEKIPVHGGSNRIYACRPNMEIIEKSVQEFLEEEENKGLGILKTYVDFAKKVQDSKNDLLSLLGKHVDAIGYGATSKSTTIFNYCGIDSSLIKYMIDTTANKQNKYTPGVHIPILSPEIGWNDAINMVFLGAWNYADEIIAKEKSFINRGGKFITHKGGIKIIP